MLYFVFLVTEPYEDMNTPEQPDDPDESPNLSDSNEEVRERDEQVASALSRIFGSEEAAASHHNQVIRELKSGEHRLQEGTGDAPAKDEVQRLTVGSDEYELSLSENYIALIKVEGLRSNRLIRRWSKSHSGSTDCRVQVEWAGQIFRAPLEQFNRVEDAREESSSVPEQANAFVEAVHPKEEDSSKQQEEEAPQSDRPSPLLRADGEGGLIEFREGQTRKGEVYLYLLRD